MPQQPPFPRSMLRASAAELIEEQLVVVEGEIPADLQGHLFLIAPVGSVSSDGLPNPDDSHVWNGNGLIHRFDLNQTPGGGIVLTTRLARTPCFWADLATRPGSAAAGLGFSDWGMSRFSVHLGMRNQLNTAFVPMRFGPDEPTRLLLTFDGGRPYEIDPVTLQVVTPVGTNVEWRPGADLPLPFPPVLSTAHPVFDPATATLFTVNYGRSTGNFLDTIPLVDRLDRLAGAVAQVFRPLAQLAGLLLAPVRSLLRRRLGVADFVHLLAWDGRGPLRRWSLVDERGEPLRIDQTMHQIGVSRDYLVLADTSLKFGLEQLLSRPFRRCPALNRLLRRLLTRPQKPDTTLYVVRRGDLSSSAPMVGEKAGAAETGSPVIARRLVIPLEVGHFLVDWANPGGRISLHAAHECATDVSEWVRPEDVSALDGRPLDPALRGMIAVGAMDLGRLGRYEIDGETGAFLARTLHDQSLTWGIGLYTCRRDVDPSAAPDGRLSSIYWQSLGFWADLLPEFLRRLYADYPHRLVPLPELLEGPAAGGGRPSALFRVDTATMTIADAYPFPQRQLAGGEWQTWVCNSPQFVPRIRPAAAPAAAADPDTDGWILCVAISEQAKELWIFDAAHLALGPLCRLAHPRFDPGYTIHTTWLECIEPRSAAYCVDARADYDPRLERVPDVVRELFEQHVYPHVEPCPRPPVTP
ncbi:carotenoid oxygenase family protein [Cyanobium sp. CH-040]|uniref:carotenoid oxygenase family protein n=1 Tax=Cyanobium sp. CH-040 TaxID=2823708 RepID=UPI0020CC010A|nr:carotenoid oxygenase family protein [Cyanobium sp. CH-040]MCP9928256.1 carotenoid oxygenase family protein [Cyanobium sp. CH-040]